jgi:hypothetical protein
MEVGMPPKLVLSPVADDWFERLPDAALVREYRFLPHPANPAPLVEVGVETFRRWGLRGLAPKPLVLGGTRHYRVGEIRRWLRGEWKSEEA